MRIASENHLIQLLRLINDSTLYSGVAMSMRNHPPGSYGIDDARTLAGKQMSTVCAVNVQKFREYSVLCEWMPNWIFVVVHGSTDFLQLKVINIKVEVKGVCQTIGIKRVQYRQTTQMLYLSEIYDCSFT